MQTSCENFNYRLEPKNHFFRRTNNTHRNTRAKRIKKIKVDWMRSTNVVSSTQKELMLGITITL